MAQPIEDQLADEDYQLITANGLGPPLAVYKIKPFYLSFLLGGGLFLLVLGIGELTFILTMIARGWHEAQVDGYILFAMFVGLPMVSLLTGIYILRIELPRVQKYRIIVCEQGLLQVKELSRRRKIEVAHWQDILTIRRLYGEYSITQRGHDAFTLAILYQNVKELVALIKIRSSLPTINHQRVFVDPEEMYPPLREKPPE